MLREAGWKGERLTAPRGRGISPQPVGQVCRDLSKPRPRNEDTTAIIILQFTIALKMMCQDHENIHQKLNL